VPKILGKVARSDGTSFNIPAETCPRCRGIGYLTGPLTYKHQTKGSDAMHVRRAGSGDCCPLCVGRGWVGVTGNLDDQGHGG
jgi:RecJ-like exonuclease